MLQTVEEDEERFAVVGGLGKSAVQTSQSEVGLLVYLRTPCAQRCSKVLDAASNLPHRTRYLSFFSIEESVDRFKGRFADALLLPRGYFVSYTQPAAY